MTTIYEFEIESTIIILDDKDILSMSPIDDQDTYSAVSGTAMAVAEALGAEYEIIDIHPSKMSSDLLYYANGIISGDFSDTVNLAKAIHECR